MKIRSIWLAAIAPALCLLAGVAASAQGAGGADAGGFVRVAPGQVHWVSSPGDHGAQFATVLGDPSKPGLYVMRARFPPHLMDTPHFHSQARYVTVLEGVWYTGTGPVFDAAKAVPLGPGSLMMHPARGVHWDGSATDRAVVVQIIGMGPVTTTQVDPKGPQWVEARR